MAKPKIRFKGYTDDWEQRKLEVFGKATGGTSIESEFSEDGIYKVISIGSYSENSVYNDQGIRAIKSDKTSNRVLNQNDLTMILNDKTTSGNIIGRVLLIEESGIYVYNQRTERIEINLDEYDPVFLYEMLNAPNIREKIIKQAQGNTQIYVNWTAISLLEYMIPSKEEQVKIGEYLHSISNLITLHQRKCEETKKLKKYMLQKMFPQNGQTVPEIRFAGFTDAWEQRKLDDWGDFYYGRSCPKWSVTENATIPCIRYGELYTKFGAKIDRVYSYTNMPPENLRFSKGTEVLIPRVGEDPMDYNHCTWLSMPDIAIGEMISVFNTDNNPLFTATMFNATLQNDFAMRVEGGSVTNLYFEKLKNIEVSFPSILEQEKIAAYFEDLDHLITLHQHKYEQLQSMKKFMLQNMFV